MDINDLPEKYQKQAEIKLNAMKKPVFIDSFGKYRNKKTQVNGITFDSKKEAQRYTELMALRKAGEIKDLRLQVNYTLMEGFTTVEGERVRPMKYIADFVYKDKDGKEIVEDVKGMRTQVYINKKKQMLDKYGIEIQEV